jgi:hypothetical protein
MISVWVTTIKPKEGGEETGTKTEVVKEYETTSVITRPDSTDSCGNLLDYALCSLGIG